MSLSLAQIIAALPKGGLYDGGWRYSPEPLRLSKEEARSLDSLGYTLARFQQASDELYRWSANGKIPRWIAETLDIGKPDWIVELQKSPGLRNALPRVIRPDLILTESGFAITELDSVPGGMGITAWLSRLYADAGFPVLGGRDGMILGFAELLAEDGAILLSNECGDHRREMEWLARETGGGRIVETADEYQPDGRALYRFFEWYEWQSIPAARILAEAVTPPCKPHLEEKLWLAMLWTPALKPIWEQALCSSHLDRIREMVPRGWVVDPATPPPQAVLPWLEVNSWEEVTKFTKKQRRLVLKISGYNELAWGSRGVHIGHDLSRTKWEEKLRTAMADFGQQPWIMQEFHPGRIVEHPVFREDGSVEIMKGRVRICPFYFIDDHGRTSLAGAGATLVPADLKKIHGMRDAVLLPCVVE